MARTGALLSLRTELYDKCIIAPALQAVMHVPRPTLTGAITYRSPSQIWQVVMVPTPEGQSIPAEGRVTKQEGLRSFKWRASRPSPCIYRRSQSVQTLEGRIMVTRRGVEFDITRTSSDRQWGRGSGPLPKRILSIAPLTDRGIPKEHLPAVPVTTNYVRVLISSHKMNGRMYVNVRCSAQGQSYYAVARIGRTSVSRGGQPAN